MHLGKRDDGLREARPVAMTIEGPPEDRRRTGDPDCPTGWRCTHCRVGAVILWLENVLPVKMLGGLRPPRNPHYGPPAPIG